MNMIVGKHYEARRLTVGSAFVSFVATVIASSATLIFSVVADLGRPESMMVTFTTAVLTAAVVFTICEMRHLAD